MALLCALLAVVGMAGYLCIFVALHLLPTGYHPVRHAVSDYGVGRYARLFRWALLLSSAGILALAAGLGFEPGTPTVTVLQLVFLFLIPVTRVGMLKFPTDLEGQRLTNSGRLHYAFAVAAFALTYAAIAGLTPELEPVGAWEPVGGFLSVLRMIALVSLVLLVIALVPRLRKVFGLFERGFLLSTNLWFLTVGICLLVEAA
ncbi:DUF998 domain-containing protein [Kribbella sp. VKM Ac-2566]|uniref:DUF998 domain-containing protein n=1 Tax=Kribbella sp. VKM Ac-2566 TaxID=2512218 RepID=UPI001063BF14|nr:DUF998 domain-containing protein [Kribbella sp. VKM Ac-2566]TDW86412.1 uncharacterized protein DUF998 [Kribbella sp. VKM Ac-2566]